ncbi:MAG: serine hydrolase domain-containing protein [Pseudoxanthomonas suwonensis]|nr:serine hydrolase domain-containing protein [Pseudoxanthomonas suwonensis]
MSVISHQTVRTLRWCSVICQANTMLSILLLLLLLLPRTASAQVGDIELRAVIGTGRTKPAPGCALAVYREGKLQHLVSDAVANLDTGALIDGDTQFYAASISKQFTAIAVVQLHLAGDLDLDRDIRIWLPELPQYQEQITPRMLLQHSSDIIDSLALVSMVHGPGQAGSFSRTATLDLVLAQTATNFVPGTSVHYSNGAYLLLSELVQRVSGQSFATYIQENILQPIGMRDSFVLEGEPHPYRNRAHGYIEQNGGWVVRDTYPRYGGSGGLMVTLNDLARYEYDIEVGKRVWTPDLRAIMETPASLTNGQVTIAMDRKAKLAYAMGLMVGQRNGRHVVEHGGGAEGFRHMYTRLPAHRMGVATFCNIGGSRALDKNVAVIELLLGAAATATSPMLTGLYRSTSLPVRYVVIQTQSDTVLVSALPDGARIPSFQITLEHVGDGEYRKGSYVLRRVADDPDVLVIGTLRASALKARRIVP